MLSLSLLVESAACCTRTSSTISGHMEKQIGQHDGGGNDDGTKP